MNPKRGFKKAMFSVELKHLHALRAEALKRAQAKGGGRMDASEVLREVLNAWMKKVGFR